MNGFGGFRKRSLIPWCPHVSYHVEEFDNTARYHNHQDEASSIKWLSLYDGSVPAENWNKPLKKSLARKKNNSNEK